MSVSTKIDFRHRRVREIEDITDIVAMIFPGNTNQQHAAARILLALKAADIPLASLRSLEQHQHISRRALECTLAKLAGDVLIESVSLQSNRAWMASFGANNRRYGCLQTVRGVAGRQETGAP